MDDFSKFRSALNGFHRADVTAYIEKLCAAHQQELKQARDEAEGLAQQLEVAKAALLSEARRSEKLETRLAETETALESTQAALEEALTLPAPESQPEEEHETLSPEEPQEDEMDYPSLELEAYRRAEAMERLSAGRAARLRQQLSDLLDEVSSRYEQTGQEIQVLTEDIRTNLKRLEDTLSDLDAIFDEATEGFGAMEEEASLAHE